MPTLPDNSAKSSGQLRPGPASSKRRGEFRPSPRHVFTVAGLPPDKPLRYPWTVFWTDWHMPDRGPYSPWPPQHKPAYGGQTGASKWAFTRDGKICIATTVRTSQEFADMVFFCWGMRPCGQSKINHRYTEPDGGKYVMEDSAL